MSQVETSKFSALAGEISTRYGEPEVGRQILVCLNPPISLSSACDVMAHVGSTFIRLAEGYRGPDLGFDLYRAGCALCSVAQDRQRILSIVGPAGVLPAARTGPDSKHPLDGYALSVSWVWSLAYYRLQPTDPSDPESDAAAAKQYGLVLDFVTEALVIGSSAIDAIEYETFLETWHKAGTLASAKLPPSLKTRSRLQTGTYAARQLGALEHRALLLALPDVSSTEQFFRSCQLLQSSPSLPRLSRSVIDSLCRLAAVRNPLFKPRQGAFGSLRTVVRDIARSQDGWIPFLNGTGAIQEMTLSDDTAVRFLFVPPKGAPSDDRVDDGLAPGELYGAPIAASVVQPEGKKGLTAKQLNSHLARRNCWLTYREESPTPNEICLLASAVRDIAASSTEASPVAMSAMASMALGRTIFIDEIRPSTYAALPLAEVEFLTDMGCWRLELRGPGYAEGPYTAKKGEIVLSRYFLAACPLPVSTLLRRYFLAPPKRPQKLSKGMVKTWIENITYPRLSASSLAMPMQDALVSLNGDLATLRMLCGLDFTHADTTTYYSTYSGEFLTRCWNTALESIWGTELVFGPTTPESLERHFGARQCPSESSVVALFTSLREFLVPEPRTLQSLIEYHNRYTAYTIGLLALGCALRPRIGQAVDDVDSEGHFTLNDKDRGDSSRRVGAYCSEVRQQLGHYSRHLERFAAEWCRYRGDLTADSTLFSNGFWFVEPATYEIRAFRPSDFSALVPDFPTPLYGLRRFFRTYCITQGLARGEFVDAVMGHWHWGVSPWDPLSTYSFDQHEMKIHELVPKLLQAASATPFPSSVRHRQVVAHD